MAKISTVYTIRNSRGEIVTTIDTGTRDTSTSLVLQGKGAPEYGLERDQNLVYLLENFSNTTAPLNPIDGQLWWKTGDQMYVFDESAGSPGGDWVSVVPPPLALGFEVTAGDGLIGGGFPTLSPLQVVLDVGAGTGIQLGSPIDSVSTKDSEIVHSNLSGYDANDHINHSSVTITAGNGLRGGGVIAGSPTSISFDVAVLDFGGVIAVDVAEGSWPQLNTFTQQDTAEWVQAESSNFRFNNDGTRAYRGCFNNGVTGGVYYGSTYSSPYVVTDSNTPTQILTTNEEVNDIAFNGDGTKVFICLDDGSGTVEERTNIGTPFNPEAGDIDTVADTYNSTNLTGVIQSIDFSADGTVVYLTGRSSLNGCVQATLSTPWDLSTAGAESTIDFTDMGVNGSYCLRIAPDGVKFYVCDTILAYEYECGTPWDITGTAVYQSRTLDIGADVPGSIHGFDVSPDGSTLVSGGQWGNNANNNDTNRFTSSVVSSVSISGNDDTGAPQGSPINVVRTSGDQRIAGIKTFRNQILADETNDATTPAYRFNTDLDTGFYRAGSNTLAFATGGMERFQVESDGVLSASTTGYTALVQHDDDIPNKQYVDNQSSAGTSPTSNTHFGTSTMTGLDGSHTYLVCVYGKVRYKGRGTTYLDGIDIWSGTSLGATTTILAQTPRQWINWPDGDIPMHNCFVVDMQGFTSLNCQLNRLDASGGNGGPFGHNDWSNQMVAVQLTNSVGVGSPGSGGGLSVTLDPPTIFDYEPSCPQTSASVTANTTGGTGPYTYAWSWDSGGAAMTIDTPTAMSTTISHAAGGNQQGVLKCIVTDTITPFATGSDQIGVEMECGT